MKFLTTLLLKPDCSVELLQVLCSNSMILQNPTHFEIIMKRFSQCAQQSHQPMPQLENRYLLRQATSALVVFLQCSPISLDQSGHG